MNLKTQEYICTLAECGSITEAAKRLYISQPALSMYISNVEKSMGIQLFDRSGKNLKLTYTGELYVHKARQMIELQDEFEREVNDIRAGVTGRIRIGLQRKRSTTLTVNIIKNFREKYPDVELQFTLGEWASLLEKYEDKALDVLIYNDQFGIDSDDGEVLLNEKVLLTVSRTDPVIGTSIYLPDMCYRWIDIHTVNGQFILSPHGASLRSDIDTFCRQNSFKIKNYTEIAHIETAMQLASEGLGICFTRESYAAQFHYIKRPVFLMVGDPILSSPLCIKYDHELLKKEYFVELLNVIKKCVESVISNNLI